jgi:hypothetical protein
MESVFANQLRYEKIRDNQQKKQGLNHRDNYVENNKSRIFAPIQTVNSFIYF